MPAIRYLVPYQLDVFAEEDQTNQKIQNTFYLKTALQTVAPPAYGDPIAGASSTTDLLTNWNAAWIAGPMTAISVHAGFTGSRIRAITGWRYPTPFRAIAAVVSGSPATVFTSTPHGLSPTDVVTISGVTTPTGVNGSWTIVVLSPNSIQLVGSAATGLYTGSGFLQKVFGDLVLTYEDNDELTAATFGSIAGDMLPAYVSADIRRINNGVGRGFRSRIGFGPLGESQQAGGILTGGTITAIDAAMATMLAIENGGSDAGSKFMRHLALSRYWAYLTPSPFTASTAFVANVTSFAVRAATGSQNSRKGRFES